MRCFSMGVCGEERWVNDVFLYGLCCEERWVMTCSLWVVL